MVLLGRAVICSSRRLSLQTTVGTVWPQFAMQVLTRGCQHQFGERGVVGSENGSLSSPVVTAYRLPIVTIGLSLTVFAVLRLVTNRRTDGQTAKGGNFVGRQTLELCNEIDHWFIQKRIVTVHRTKIGLCWSDFFVYFSFNAKNAAAVAGNSDDSDVVAGVAS